MRRIQVEVFWYPFFRSIECWTEEVDEDTDLQAYAELIHEENSAFDAEIIFHPAVSIIGEFLGGKVFWVDSEEKERKRDAD